MRLFSGKITILSDELAKALVDGGDIECESRKDVAKDLESVFANYLQVEREVGDKAKDMLEARGLAQTELPRLRKLVAEQKGIQLGDDLLDYLQDQLIEMLMHSGAVEEVYAADHDLRRRMRPILRKHLEVDETLEAEVRAQLKHVKEGTRTWEIEYQRMLGDIQRRKGLR
jgi:hypothetical protein